MPLRTPRRRISSRTKRRYRAIRNFFRKTLGNVSQPDIKINSSIAFNVTDLKSKIGIEHQPDEVSKHCRDHTSFENISRREIESVFPTEENEKNNSDILREQLSERNSVHNDTKVLYKIEENHLSKPYSACETKVYNEPRDRDWRLLQRMNYETQTSSHNIPKVTLKKNRRDTYYENFGADIPKLRKHRTQVNLEDLAMYADSYHSLAIPSAGRRPPSDYKIQRQERRRLYKEQHIQSTVPEEPKMKRHKDKIKRHKSVSPARLQDESREKSKSKRNRPGTAKLDQDFIAEIINRQYRPVKLFGSRESDLSQISSPVCRDQEYPTVHEAERNKKLCSCCVTGRSPARCQHARASELSDMRSLCDTRLYRPRPRHRTRSRHRRQQLDIYNDSNYYDVIPVKEKSSPKSRRKFAEDNVIQYEYLREVPPSPKSQRPRLNLQAQNYDCEVYTIRDKQSRRRRLPYQQKRPEYVDTFRFRDDLSTEDSAQISYNEIQPQLTRHTRNAQIQEDMNSVQYPTLANDNRNTTQNENLNKTDSTNDKTDQALCEIKDILQSFLQEIKKESTASQCDKSNHEIGKTKTNPLHEFQEDSTKEIPSALQSSGHNYGLGQCSISAVPPQYMPGVTNPCCYPVICPMNCLQNGFLLPSPSFACHGCTNSHKDSDGKHSCCSKENGPCEPNTTKKNSETEDLIREIHKFVAQNPNARRKDSFGNTLYSPRNAGFSEKKLMSRGVGKSKHPSKHDANVGTPPRLCCSKSCEAIGSRNTSDTYYSHTNVSYSDTVLEKLSLEATTHSTTAFETSDSSAIDKRKKSKFASVLQSFGLLKKNKKNRKDVIEELSESESTTEADVHPKHRHPFRQDVANYMMHEQQFFHPPPVPPYHRQDNPRQPQHPRDPSPHYDHGCSYDCPMNRYSRPSPVNDMYDPYRARERSASPPYGHMRPQASAPPYPHACEHQCSHNMQPQVPLCLKEIEVKSTGTQSERKMPFFRKLSQKVQPPPVRSRDEYQKTNGTQTVQKKPGLWQELQAKAAASKFPDMDPFAFSLKGQKKLAQGDVKMRNAVLKKLFYKRNPFSPRNLIVRTLLGRDKSSWGMPPSGMVHRPKMFL